MPDLNTAEPFAVLNKKDPNVSKSIIIIPSTNRNQPEKQQEAKTEENADKLPQVVNVSGGIHLPPSSVGRGLHLVVSRSPQKNTILNFQASVSQKNTILNYQPNIVVSGSVIKGVETRPKTNTPRPHSASSAAQRPPLILNSVLAGRAPPLALLSSTQLRAAPAGAASLNNVLFSSVPGHTMHSTPMLVRSVQAGPTCAPTTLPPWARTQPPNHPPAQPPYPPPAQHRTSHLHNPCDPCRRDWRARLESNPLGHAHNPQTPHRTTP
ncbi:uncharacterized protein LOC133531877 [Cydia pomonella]|uniref:uncharacterized protein LOC133531877 n=1 Tax=Cydia pomonella TaxID=82600 RepID=UPI002ADD46DF|nr:uncharacterized protein LOC133531877 [Cydia pomonella]